MSQWICDQQPYTSKYYIRPNTWRDQRLDTSCLGCDLCSECTLTSRMKRSKFSSKQEIFLNQDYPFPGKVESTNLFMVTREGNIFVEGHTGRLLMFEGYENKTLSKNVPV